MPPVRYLPRAARADETVNKCSTEGCLILSARNITLPGSNIDRNTPHVHHLHSPPRLHHHHHPQYHIHNLVLLPLSPPPSLAPTQPPHMPASPPKPPSHSSSERKSTHGMRFQNLIHSSTDPPYPPKGPAPINLGLNRMPHNGYSINVWRLRRSMIAVKRTMPVRPALKGPTTGILMWSSEMPIGSDTEQPTVEFIGQLACVSTIVLWFGISWYRSRLRSENSSILLQLEICLRISPSVQRCSMRLLFPHDTSVSFALPGGAIQLQYPARGVRIPSLTQIRDPSQQFLNNAMSGAGSIPKQLLIAVSENVPAYPKEGPFFSRDLEGSNSQDCH